MQHSAFQTSVVLREILANLETELLQPHRMPFKSFRQWVDRYFAQGVMGAALFYAFNTLPYLQQDYFTSIDRPTFMKMQACAVIGYFTLAIAMQMIANRFHHQLGKLGRNLHWSWRLSAMSILLSLTNIVVLSLLILPTFELITRQTWSHPWNMAINCAFMGTVIDLSQRLSASNRNQRERQLQTTLEADKLNILLNEAELALLESQIEPHFLFNTLAHIKRQLKKGSPDGQTILVALISYLKSSWPAIRRPDWTLADEFDLAAGYLKLLKFRFGDRLKFSLTATHASRGIRIPALLVTTLVENAVRHGISPKPDGGSLSIVSEIRNDALIIRVEDDGVGFQKSSGAGLGLSSIRARLAGTFGNRASLSLQARACGGVSAEISIPISITSHVAKYNQ